MRISSLAVRNPNGEMIVSHSGDDTPFLKKPELER